VDIDEMPIVRLTWQDAKDSDGTWTDIEDILNHEPAVCQEVGWMVYEDDKKVIVMRSRIVGEEVGGAYITIPKSWVMCLEELEFEPSPIV